MTKLSELEYVRFWARVWASLIDTVLMSIVIFLILFAVYGLEQMVFGVTFIGTTNILISYVLPVLAVIAFWTVKHATPGKIAIDATIVDAKTGKPPSLMQHVIRYVSHFVSTIPFCLGFILVGFDRKTGMA